MSQKINDARNGAWYSEPIGQMVVNKNWHQKDTEAEFFCRVRDAFRVFARRSSEVLGSAWAFIAAIAIIAIWALTGPTFHFSDTWQLIINTGTTIVTFLMVFLIQNELIRAVQGARNNLVDLEKLSDEELKKLEEQFTRLREQAQKATERVSELQALEKI